ncbi:MULTISPECIES: glycoside hydrolase family 32 protein [unclassified Streptomyces]|uniref:glycoside hydrolase family 32 protein n=1 Tax=unclassified Streptomyces TaxID=2593676 RepID=UPI002253B780|nr:MULTISPECIES: glycoside hydrolase family 32 protein [unclassified Streptomyces]MCX5328589.1 glycoside hydrolase family 32 protein [Streptomyces sp. NBC_00140]MCX5357999.1 glycoside hydrolase family 32 protein [Streptomyces sp. NBC_00124]
MSVTPADPHLPVAHLRPPRNWINDPNGLAFHDGHYHVCFQYNPHGPEHANMHWGHFRSPDLITWEELPVALAPTPGGEDADGCFSGNAISDGDRMVAFYSAHRDDRWWQPVTTAESRDNGVTWTTRGSLLIPEPPEGATMYRDPYVWREADRWRMLVGTAQADGRAAALLYESGDLEQWKYRGHFLDRAPQPVAQDADTGLGWECPQYLHADGRGALLLGAWDPELGPRRTVVYPGREQDGRFLAGDPVLLDHGPDFYAPALLNAPDGRWLLWGWSWEARDPKWVRESGWAGLLTLPREVTLAEDGSVRQRPAAELLALRDERAVTATGETAGTAVLGTVGPSFDLTARLEPRHAESAGTAGGLRLVTSADGTEYLDIRIDAAGELVVDRDHASLDPRAHGGTYRVPCPEARAVSGAPVELRLVVDRSVAELYLPSGRALTLRFYPTGGAPWRIEAHAGGEGSLGYTVGAWNLRPYTMRHTADSDAQSALPDTGLVRP